MSIIQVRSRVEMRRRQKRKWREGGRAHAEEEFCVPSREGTKERLVVRKLKFARKL